MTELPLRHLHIAAVLASFGLFFVRGVWMMTDPARLAVRWVRVVPHVVDSVLLASAVGLAVRTAQYPFVQGWLTAKVLALVAYIVLGTIALRRGRSRTVRICAWLLAVGVFGYIVTVAHTRTPFPWHGVG